MAISLNDSIRYIKGVGPSREKLFNNLGINTVQDLIYYFPRDYEDRSIKKPIMSLVDGEKVSFDATIKGDVRLNKTRTKLSITKAEAVDESGKVELTWFNSPYIKTSLKSGVKYTFYGQIKREFNKIEVVNPIFEEAGNEKSTGKILAVYPSTAGLTQTAIRSTVRNVFDEFHHKFDEFMPDSIRLRYNLVDINQALYYIHFPDFRDSFVEARRRLVFEELLMLELGLMKLKSIQEDEKDGIEFEKSEKVNEFINKLPFELTNAQNKVLNAIFDDMKLCRPMNRLLQGDVGSGKTIVAAISIYNAVMNGYQAVMMAPTSILAEQHFNSFKELFESEGIKVELLSGSLTAKEKRRVKDRIATGITDIVVGTHALLEDDVVFSNLGFVVTDEQHRFGVKQRSKLSDKGRNPDTLIMTATPIPRTLALILYGDLDISIIDELPPNRKKIDTLLVGPSLEERLNGFIEKEISAGRQAYVVCPLIEEGEESTDKAKLKNVMDVYEEYKKRFPDFRIEILHGKMKSSLKDEIMLKFKEGEVDILISTTVIEVGVNVPNATLMIIENSERFGLAALHQLRGRVGRGSEKSYCVLKCYSRSATARDRMEVMVKTDDGFKISEKDLELRGPGEFLGIRQHGLPEFKIANIFADKEVLEQTTLVAKEIIKDYNGNAEYKALFDKVDEKFRSVTL